MKKNRSVSAATKARLRALRQKFGLGEFKGSASRKIKRGGAIMARRSRSYRRSRGGSGETINSIAKGAIGAIAVKMFLGNKYGIIQDAAAGAGATMLLKGNKLYGAVGGVAGPMLLGKLSTIPSSGVSTSNEQWFG